MNCTGFELWLDTTGGAEPPAAMQMHVATCEHCRAALATARAIDAALAAGPPHAPAGFASRVLGQITSPAGIASRDPRVAQRAIPLRAGDEAPIVESWWRMLLTDPAFIFALCCAVLATWLPQYAPGSLALASEWLQPYFRLVSGAVHAIPSPQSAAARASLWSSALCAAAAGAAILGRWSYAKARQGAPAARLH